MVYTHLNRIQFGNGDVSIMVSMAGTREEPQAMLVFQNREPTEIGGIDSDADLSKTVKGVYHPHDDIAMLFSKPESIDSVVSALLAVKRATFGKHHKAVCSLKVIYFLDPPQDNFRLLLAVQVQKQTP